MVQKEFTYKGKKVEELVKMSLAELATMMHSDARRRIIRLSDADKKLIKKIENCKKPVKTHRRNMIILPTFVGKTVMIHGGKEYQQVVITPEMIGHWLGEYALTRKRVGHSAPGVGATRSSSNLSVK
ncbi:30S ribosomal protein S19 [Candidatus Woesearchaeota archaeon]|nr:30S ribosomal protein S19 [Candidatus Woesearchaeota archaeon]